jgi:hypothetical protein
MAGLILLKPGVDWEATGGLFDWTLEFLMPRLSDKDAVQRLREVVDNNLGSLWLNELSPQAQQEIVNQLRKGLIAAAESELPETDRKADAIRHLQELVDLTYELDKAE